MQFWLMKSEPDTFSIDDLAARPQQTEHWDGVRNYQARNMMRDQMRCGDQVFFYHSNCALPGIVGIAQVVREGYPDFTAFDPTDTHFDPKSQPDKPTWFMVDVQFVEKWSQTLSLQLLKQQAALAELALVRRGNRLSIMPVSPDHWQHILGLRS
jgi:predicted RNA-binding protein with PUA-like domain